MQQQKIKITKKENISDSCFKLSLKSDYFEKNC